MEHILPIDSKERAAIAPLFSHLDKLSPAKLFFDGATLLDRPIFINGRADLNEESFKIFGKLIERGLHEGIEKESINRALSHLASLAKAPEAKGDPRDPYSWDARGSELMALVR